MNDELRRAIVNVKFDECQQLAREGVISALYQYRESVQRVRSMADAAGLTATRVAARDQLDAIDAAIGQLRGES